MKNLCTVSCCSEGVVLLANGLFHSLFTPIAKLIDYYFNNRLIVLALHLIIASNTKVVIIIVVAKFV